MKRGLVHIEILRVIAICFVVFNHTWTSGYMLYSAVGRSYRYYYPLLFLSILCKIAVPVFFMISGALLLGREETYRELYGKRVARMLLALILFSFVEYCYKLALGAGNVGAAFRAVADGFRPADFFRGIYSEEQAAAYWYLYAYLDFLVMLPLLRKMVRAMRAEDYRYLVVLQLVIVGGLPILEYFLWGGAYTVQKDFDIVFVTTAGVFYPLIGYALEHVLEERWYTGKHALILTALGVAAIVICCLLTTDRMQITGEKTAEVFHNSLIALPACAAYFTAKFLCEKYKLPNPVRRLASVAGSTVFGIMLLEDILRKELMGIFESLKPTVGIFPACVVWVAAVVVFGAVLSWSLKRIPGVKRLL